MIELQENILRLTDKSLRCISLSRMMEIPLPQHAEWWSLIGLLRIRRCRTRYSSAAAFVQRKIRQNTCS